MTLPVVQRGVERVVGMNSTHIADLSNLCIGRVEYDTTVRSIGTDL